FYSVEQLPGPLVALTHANPFFYMIDGFRYGFIGYADGSLDAGLAVMAGSALALCILAHRMLASGYKLKA
ncbi:MAG TPA: multidrug ABC transporter permease, partial [Alphaproteobacteria bacterium]|nr:multidrug ABC transporter permease [Alphaproteobacteria bacterium]